MVRFLKGDGNFSLHRRVQNGSGAQTASYPMGTGGSFSGGKAAGAWSWPLTSIYCRGQSMRGAIHPLPQYASMAWCLVKHWDNFTFFMLQVMSDVSFLNKWRNYIWASYKVGVYFGPYGQKWNSPNNVYYRSCSWGLWRRRACCRRLNAGSKVIRNVGILPHHYKASQTTRGRL